MWNQGSFLDIFVGSSLLAPRTGKEMNTEEYGFTPENRFRDVRRNPLSTFSIDVDTASYSRIRRFLTEGKMPPWEAVRIEELINYFRYAYPEPSDGQPFSVTVGMAVCPWTPEHRLLRIGLKSRSLAMSGAPPSNLVFLVDVSGSMASPDKLPLLKKAFGLLVEQLREQDRVAVVAYAGSAGLVLDSTPGSQKEDISHAITALESGGSTAGGEGIRLAYQIARKNFLRDGNNRVILATDGDFNVGESSDGAMVALIEAERESGVFLSVLGFGDSNLKDSKMEKLADHGNGNYAYIDTLLEARRVLVAEIGATLVTVAKDVKVQVEFNPAAVGAYRLLGYENRLLAAEDFNNDAKDAGDLGAGHTVTVLYEIAPAAVSSPAGFVDKLKYQEVIESSWARGSGEGATVKVRYKEPAGNRSQLLAQVVRGEVETIEQASADFRFAAAIAAFGMLLRDDPLKGQAGYDQVLSLAGSGNNDAARSEFLHLVQTARRLSE